MKLNLNTAIVQKHSTPYYWVSLENLFDTEEHQTLMSEYPTTGFSEAASQKIEKTYQFSVNNIVVNNELLPSFEFISPHWQSMISTLLSRQYQEFISEIVQIDIINNPVSIGFYKFNYGDGVSRHIDKENKLFTQLFYFNNEWLSPWGGQLNLLDETYHVVKSIEPNSSCSVIIPRSPMAWHEVQMISEWAKAPRQSLQFEVWK